MNRALPRGTLDHWMHATPGGLKTMAAERPSVCTFDCPDTCSLTVTVDNGQIIKVRGSKALPFTDGVICNKVAHSSFEFNHGPGRLRFPLRRSGPRGAGLFERISWEEALDTDSSENHGRDRPLGSAGRDAAQLCRPAWNAVARQHVVALLPQARCDEAFPWIVMRTCPQRGLGRDLWRTRRASAPRRAPTRS